MYPVFKQREATDVVAYNVPVWDKVKKVYTDEVRRTLFVSTGADSTGNDVLQQVLAERTAGEKRFVLFVDFVDNQEKTTT